MEIVFAQYQSSAMTLYGKYLDLYNTEFPTDKTYKTALKFLDAHYSEYRLEVTALAMSILKQNKYSTILSSRILDQNASNIILLYDKIMEMSKDGKV